MKKMKLIGWSSLMAAVLASTLWMQQGCVGNFAPLALMVVTSTPTLSPSVISNFESGTTAVNPTLRNTGGYPGNFTVNTYGGSPPNSINNPFVLMPGNASNYAIHVFASLSGTGAYEADQISCNLTSGAPTPYYDATGFTGVQFDINIPPANTNPQKVFQVAIDLTTPTSSPGGTCLSGCYNHYTANLATTAGWSTVTLPWASITYPGYGTNNGPLAGHLNKILFLMWSFSANGAVVTTYTDVYIDNVRFTP